MLEMILNGLTLWLEFMPCGSICWETIEVEYIIIDEVKY